MFLCLQGGQEFGDTFSRGKYNATGNVIGLVLVMPYGVTVGDSAGVEGSETSMRLPTAVLAHRILGR